MFASSLTLPRLLDDVWLLVHWLLVCWLRLLVEGLNCSLGEGLAFSCKKSINKQRQYYPSSPVLAPDTTVVSCFSFLSSPNSSTSSAVGLTLSVLSDSDLRGLMTCLTPPTWDTYQWYDDTETDHDQSSNIPWRRGHGLPWDQLRHQPCFSVNSFVLETINTRWWNKVMNQPRIHISSLSTVVNDEQRINRTNKTISDVNGASHGSRLEETAE